MAARIIPQDFYVYLHRRATDNTVFYVGKGVRKRAWSHKNRNPHWHRSVKKYGMRVEVVASGLQAWYALELERDFVLRFESHRLTNLTCGGEGIWMASEETKKKISQSKKGKKLAPETIKKIIESRAGYQHTEKTRKKIAEGQRGNKRGPETGEKIRLKNLGRVTSEETKKKLIIAGKGKKLSDEHKKRLRKVWLGKKHTPEALEKMRLAQSNRPPISEETRAKLSAASKGRKRSSEAIAKTVAFHTGRKRSDAFKERMREVALNRPKEQREKQAEKLRGRKHSAEHKEKIRLANLARWAKIKAQKTVADF